MNPLEFFVRKLAFNDAGDAATRGEKTPSDRGVLHPASLSATFVDDAAHAVVMEHRSQPPSRWRAFRALMDAEVDLEFLGLTDAATFARLARERLEERGLE